MKKVRTSKVFFVKDSPFKPRIVRNKKAFSRKIKHKGQF